MKKFDLSTVEVSSLSSDDIIELKRYLKTTSVRACVNFILHVMDTEYTLSEINKNNDKVEKFIADKQFEYLRYIIMRVSDDDFSESEWIQIEREHTVKQRKEKLSKIRKNEEM